MGALGPAGLQGTETLTLQPISEHEIVPPSSDFYFHKAMAGFNSVTILLEFQTFIKKKLVALQF